MDLLARSIKKIKAGDTVIVLDDGAELLNIFSREKGALPSSVKIIGIEQTSSGFRKLENEKLRFPVINVARSKIKLGRESPFIARLGCERTEEVLREYKISKPRFLVVGLGPVGDNMVFLLKKSGYSVASHDTAIHSEKELVDLVLKDGINIVIGATGKNILTTEQVRKLDDRASDKIYLISMSSSDREFPATFLRSISTKLDNSIHGDVSWKNIVLINNGFPITFYGNRYEGLPSEIEETIAQLYGSILYAITTTIEAIGLVDVPKNITDTIEHRHSIGA